MNALFKISNTESLGPRLKIREMARKMSVKPNRSSIDSTQQEEYPLLKDNLRSAEVVSYQSASKSGLADVAVHVASIKNPQQRNRSSNQTQKSVHRMNMVTDRWTRMFHIMQVCQR